MAESAVLSHQPHSGDTSICYITSSLAYLSSGEWSNCYSEAFRIRRKKLNDNFILTPCKSSIPLVLKHLLSTHRLLWTTEAVRASPLSPYLTAAAQNLVFRTQDSKHEYLTANCNCDIKVNYRALVCGRFLNLCQKCRQGLNNQLPLYRLQGSGIETNALLAALKSVLPKGMREGVSPGRSHGQQREKGSNSQTLVQI